MRRPRVLLIINLLMTFSFVFNLIPNLTVPVVSDLTISTDANIQFGAYGWCIKDPELGATLCTAASIGYNTTGFATEYPLYLPSYTNILVTKLLIVHLLAVIVTFLLWILCLLLLFTDLDTSPQFTLLAALMSLPTFILSLFCLLIDLLLFVSKLNWPGWMLLVVTVFLAICCSLLWQLRRTVMNRRYETLYTDSNNSIKINMYSMSDLKPRVLNGNT